MLYIFTEKILTTYFAAKHIIGLICSTGSFVKTATEQLGPRLGAPVPSRNMMQTDIHRSVLQFS